MSSTLRVLVFAWSCLVTTAFAQNSGWTIRNQRAGAGILWAIAAGNGRIVTVGDAGRILSSADGVTWTARASGVTDWLVGVTYGAGRFVAVGDNGKILVSSNGDTWTLLSGVPTTARLNNVIYANNRFVAVGEQGSALVSTDGGNTWARGTTGVTGWLRGLTYLITRSYFYAPLGNGSGGANAIVRVPEFRFVASGQGGRIITSLDGLTWTSMTSGTTEDLEAVVAWRSSGTYGLIGPDSAVAIGSAGTVRSYAAPLANFVGDPVLGYRGIPPDLPPFANWAADSLGATTDVRLRGLARNGDPDDPNYWQRPPVLLASGESGVVILENQIQRTGLTQNLVASLYYRDKFYVTGENETILQQTAPVYLFKLGNLATQGAAGGTRGVLIGGIVIGGSAAQRVLVRAAGPALTGFGVPGAMPQPTLTLFDAAGRTLLTNSGWNNDANVAATSAAVGAFPFGANSRDAAIVTSLQPGNYTVHLQPAAGTAAGATLFEIYDASAAANDGPRLLNVASRGFVGLGENLIGGFVITGSSRGNVLIRGIGPTLRALGVTDALTACAITVYNSASQPIATNNGWSTSSNATQIAFAARQVGGFALADASPDAALILSGLAPGAYTVHLATANTASGTGLIEIYELP